MRALGARREGALDHVRVGSRTAPRWELNAVVADVKRRPVVRLPHSFVFDRPTGAQLVRHRRRQRAQLRHRGLRSGRIRFQRVSCGTRLRIAFRFNGRVGSELGDGEPLSVRGSFSAQLRMTEDRREMDYRFSLANERTFLAWIRTALALVAGGVFAAKGLRFEHEVWRWVIAPPPIVAGAALAIDARARWRRYERRCSPSGRCRTHGASRARHRPGGLRARRAGRLRPRGLT